MKTLKLKKVLTVSRITIHIANCKRYELVDPKEMNQVLALLPHQHREYLAWNLKLIKRKANIGSKGSIDCVRQLDSPKIQHFIVEWTVNLAF